MFDKYADLLTNYCVEVQPGEKVYVKTTTEAEPLVSELQRAVLEAGGVMDVEFVYRSQLETLLAKGNESQLSHISPLNIEGIKNYDCYIHIMAPFEDQGSDMDNAEAHAIYSKARAEIMKSYFTRTADRSLKRTLCQFPSPRAAEIAGMSIEDYSDYVFRCCKLNLDDPIAGWKQVHDFQQRIVDHLNNKETVRYTNNKSDISFSTKGRTWINSDGKTNMPSGEVYTSPVEDSVNGHIVYDVPTMYKGSPVENIKLEVKDGYVESWEAEVGQDVLDKVFQIDGARRFGEAAIGTNENIDRITRNILYDEKMGGTVHMAIGQSYLQAGGKNESAVHWDMLAEMRNGGKIFADDELIYENGKFLI